MSVDPPKPSVAHTRSRNEQGQPSREANSGAEQNGVLFGACSRTDGPFCSAVAQQRFCSAFCWAAACSDVDVMIFADCGPRPAVRRPGVRPGADGRAAAAAAAARRCGRIPRRHPLRVPHGGRGDAADAARRPPGDRNGASAVLAAGGGGPDSAPTRPVAARAAGRPPFACGPPSARALWDPAPRPCGCRRRAAEAAGAGVYPPPRGHDGRRGGGGGPRAPLPVVPPTRPARAGAPAGAAGGAPPGPPARPRRRPSAESLLAAAAHHRRRGGGMGGPTALGPSARAGGGDSPRLAAGHPRWRWRPMTAA